MFATRGDLNLNAADQSLKGLRAVWRWEHTTGDRSAEGATNGIADDVPKRGAEERVARQRLGALGGVKRAPEVVIAES